MEINRISTYQLFQNGTNRLAQVNSQLAIAMNEITTGKRVNVPSDAPVAFSLAQNREDQNVRITQYARNSGRASDFLTNYENNINGVIDNLKGFRDSFVAVLNGSNNNPNEINSFKQVAKSFNDSILSLSNTKDGDGNYIYSGFKSNTVPFVLSGSAITYAGDGGKRDVQINEMNTVGVNLVGTEVFGADGDNVFDVFNQALSLNQVNKNDSVFTSDILNKIDRFIEKGTSALSIIGSRLNVIDGNAKSNQAIQLQNQQTISDLVDADLSESVSRLMQYQQQLEAIQKTYAVIGKTSLFNYI